MNAHEPPDVSTNSAKTFDQLFAEVFEERNPTTAPVEIKDIKECE